MEGKLWAQAEKMEGESNEEMVGETMGETKGDKKKRLKGNWHLFGPKNTTKNYLFQILRRSPPKAKITSFQTEVLRMH